MTDSTIAYSRQHLSYSPVWLSCLIPRNDYDPAIQQYYVTYFATTNHVMWLFVSCVFYLIHNRPATLSKIDAFGSTEFREGGECLFDTID